MHFTVVKLYKHYIFFISRIRKSFEEKFCKQKQWIYFLFHGIIFIILLRKGDIYGISNKYSRKSVYNR